MSAAVSWLEARYEAVSAALSRLRLGEPLTAADRSLLAEARIETGAPPRPAAHPPWSPGWHWHPRAEPGPDDGRAHP